MLHRPEPFLDPTGLRATEHTDVDEVITRLRRGETVRVTDRYATGAELLTRLDRAAPPPDPTGHYGERMEALHDRRAVALRLLAPIRDHALDLVGARPIGFLAELYPDLDHFWLPFLQVQELYDAWQRYRTGTHLAVLGGRVHPVVGTYVPTRTEHLELFGTWLAGWQGSRERAVDVGTGCGVLARMLRRAGFAHVRATDINPNAVETVRRDVERFELSGIEPVDTDLLGPPPHAFDLVVCNPPWLPGHPDEPFDAALQYAPGWFERFFDAAVDAVAPDGRVVLLFSTIGTLTRPDVPHPIEEELARGRLALVARTQRRMKGTAGPDGRRRRTKERVSVWELRPL